MTRRCGSPTTKQPTPTFMRRIDPGGACEAVFEKQVERAGVERRTSMSNGDDPVASFIEAACVPRDTGHASGTLEHAEAILAAQPEVARSDVHTAAILGDDAA